ncbi:MAG: GAF domain-containing protein [Methanobacteriota archaeon]|nr:MAG: GAF domain-containing protein [Euryarchaeota archaeon]
MSTRVSDDAEGLESRLVSVLRSRMDEAVEQWIAEATSAPYTRIADFSVSKESRAARLKTCLIAVLDLIEHPGSASARESFRLAVRSEHLRSIGLVRMVSNQHVLRRIFRDILSSEFESDEFVRVNAVVERITDVCVEETVILVEQYLDAQSVLTRCAWDAEDEVPDPEQTYAAFCRNVMEYFDADFTAVFRVNVDTREIVCMSCFAKGMSLSRDTRIGFDHVPLITAAIAQRRSLSCLDLPVGLASRVRITAGTTFEHCMASPLLRGNDVIGVMVVGDNSRSSHYTPEEVGMSEELARLVSNSLDSTEKLRVLSFRSRAQRSLIDAAADMQKEIDSEEIYRILANKLVELIPSHEVAFYVFDWNRSVCNAVYATGPYATEIMADRDFPATVGIVGSVAKTRRAEIVPDTETDPRGEQIPDTPAVHMSMLAVPILGRKEVLGVIELLRHLPAGYSEDEMEIAKMFASHVAVAVENARLLKEVMKVRDEVELHMDLLMHDIANYSTPMMGYLETLKDGEFADPAVVEKMIDQVENISRMIDMVRTLAKLREEQPIELRRMDLRAAVEQAEEVVRSRRAGRRINLSSEFPDGPVMVRADVMLPELFMGLFFTALSPGRRDAVDLSVKVNDDQNGDGWLVRVTHPGRGMPDRLKSEIMRVAKTSKSELAGGFGIALASAKGILERYSGEIWVSDIDRDDPGKGFVFNVRMPKAS